MKKNTILWLKKFLFNWRLGEGERGTFPNIRNQPTTNLSERQKNFFHRNVLSEREMSDDQLSTIASKNWSRDCRDFVRIQKRVLNRGRRPQFSTFFDAPFAVATATIGLADCSCLSEKLDETPLETPEKEIRRIKIDLG